MIGIDSSLALFSAGRPPLESCEGSKEKFKKLMVRVWEVAKVGIAAAAAIGLYVLNPAFFVVGTIAGVAFYRHGKKAIDNIIDVWKKMPWAATAIVAAAAFLSLPVATAALSLSYGTWLGTHLYEKSNST